MSQRCAARSNIAWNNGDRLAGDKPMAANISLVVAKLRESGFTDVLVLCDANLAHEVNDKPVYAELLNSKLIQSVPSKTDADEFIINYAKEFNARIVTNDTYSKDWAQSDTWIRDHAKDLSIRFMIINDKVKLSFAAGEAPTGGIKATDFDFSGFGRFKDTHSSHRSY